MRTSLKSIALSFTIIAGISACNYEKDKLKEKSQIKIQHSMKATENGIPKISEFPLGDENKGFEQYFTGRSWLAPLTNNKQLALPMFNVTFEPGCINNWHSHSEGQILIGTGGVGYIQERGKPARRILPGMVIEIAANVEHWHGATKDDWFSHIAINPKPETNKNTWLEPVTKDEYATANSID